MKPNWRQLTWATYGLLTVQIGVFLWETLNGGSFNTQTLISAGARLNGLIAQGQWWRLLTPLFVHIGWSHLIINSLTLYFVGIQLERLYGSGRFLIMYLVSGIGGNLFGWAFGNANALAAGASTSLFGLFGIFAALGFIFANNPAVKEWSKQFIVLIVLNLITDLFMGQIDIWGHIGGVISGILLAGLIPVPQQTSNLALSKRLFCGGLLVILALGLSYLGVQRG